MNFFTRGKGREKGEKGKEKEREREESSVNGISGDSGVDKSLQPRGHTREATSAEETEEFR